MLSVDHLVKFEDLQDRTVLSIRLLGEQTHRISAAVPLEWTLRTVPLLLSLPDHPLRSTQEDKDALLACKPPPEDRTSRKQATTLLSMEGQHLHRIPKGSLSSTTLGQGRLFSFYDGPFLMTEEKCESKTQNCARAQVLVDFSSR